MNNTKTYIFDIDGTIADSSHRLRHIVGIKNSDRDWGKFRRLAPFDKRIQETLTIATLLLQAPSTDIIFVTGRSNLNRNVTVSWIESAFAKCGIVIEGVHDRLYMRPSHDTRPDTEVKSDIYEMLLKQKYNIVGVFEDRKRVVDMWRSKGLRVYHVEDGNF